VKCPHSVSKLWLPRLFKNYFIISEDSIVIKWCLYHYGWLYLKTYIYVQVNRMPRNRLPRVMKHYSATGRRNHGRTLKRLLDTWDRDGSTSGPTPWQIYDDDDDDDVNLQIQVRGISVLVLSKTKFSNIYMCSEDRCSILNICPEDQIST